MDPALPSPESRQRGVFVDGPEALEAMPDEYRELLRHQLLAHAEGELTGADYYVKVLYPLAPDAYERKVCCERAAEEMDHYMRAAKLLGDIGVDTRHMLDQNLCDRDRYRTELCQSCDGWIDRGFFSMLGESAVMDHIVEMSQSSYQPLARMCVPVIRDEKVHVAHGFRIIRDLCKDPGRRAEVQRVLDTYWGSTLDLFGRSDSERSRLYLKWGLRQLPNEEARRRFSARTRPILEDLGLRVPDDAVNRKFT